MQLALDGINAYKNWKEFLGDPDAKAYFTQTDALWMLGKSKAENETMKARLAAYGVESHLLDEAGLKERFPLMNPEPFPKFDENFEIVEQNLGELSALLEVGCGHLDSSFCLEDMDKAARRHGADVRMKQKVESFIEESGVVKGVKMADGSSIHAGFTVNAAGPWFNKLNDTVGVKLSTTALPTRIQVSPPLLSLIDHNSSQLLRLMHLYHPPQLNSLAIKSV
jgi:glycine/D-amino acid oxidase-like deaminating enzyme